MKMRDGSFNYGADYENKIDVSNSQLDETQSDQIRKMER